jgi:hypothetical protein
VIRVTVEIVPYGIEALRREIGRLEVANDATGDGVVDNYRWRLLDAG